MVEMEDQIFNLQGKKVMSITIELSSLRKINKIIYGKF